MCCPELRLMPEMPMCIKASELMRSFVKSFIRVCRAMVKLGEYISMRLALGEKWLESASPPEVPCVVESVEAEEVN